MRGNSNTGHYAQVKVGQKGAGNQDAVKKVMQAVTHQDHGPGGMLAALLIRCMHFAVVGMAMPPQHQLFQYKKPQQAQ